MDDWFPSARLYQVRRACSHRATERGRRSPKGGIQDGRTPRLQPRDHGAQLNPVSFWSLKDYFIHQEYENEILVNMAFSEELKLKIRKRAAFRCCICQVIPVEIHHIDPQSNGGSDDEDNAAPLCPTCHERYGNNPSWRKKITEMRDYWYSVVSVKYPTPSEDLLNPLNQALIEHSTQDIKEHLRKYLYSLIETIDSRRLPKLTDLFLNGIQLESGIFVPIEDLVYEGPCACEREVCVGQNHRVYCYFTKKQSKWVVAKKLYWQCYDEIVKCPRCLQQHARGHIGRNDKCLKPYRNQENQTDQ